MYQKGRIQEEDYDREYEALEQKLKELNKSQEEKYDFTRLKELLKTNSIEQYYKSDKLTKQGFWNTLIEEIIINENKEIIKVIFLI